MHPSKVLSRERLTESLPNQLLTGESDSQTSLQEAQMRNNSPSDSREMQARSTGGTGAPTRSDSNNEQSSVVRNPAPDASPSAVPSPSKTFTVSC